MKERQILFSNELVRAILDGRKAQTRRVIKPQPPGWVSVFKVLLDGLWRYGMGGCRHPSATQKGYRCPYGVPGDRLWVRETHNWITLAENEYDRTNSAHRRHSDGYPVHVLYRATPDWEPPSWRPSIHMPRWASRITLDVTDVRVERVQDIDVYDIRAEGIASRGYPGTEKALHAAWKAEHQEFRELWDSINAKRGYGWDVNPWVWVIEFNADK